MFSCPDEDIEDGFDEVGYDNDCTEKLKTLYPSGRKNLSSFSDYYQSEVHDSDGSKNGPVQSQLKADHQSDSSDDSISDEDSIAGTEHSLAYQCGTSRLGQNYTSSERCEESEASEWNQILEECSVLDSQPKKPGDEGMTKLKVSIHSNSDHKRPSQELKIKKENTCTGGKNISADEEFDILEDVNEEVDVAPYDLVPYKLKDGLYPSMAELLEGLQGNNCASSFLNSNVKATDREEKKRKLPKLGERTLEDEEDAPEYMPGHASSDEEEISRSKLNLLPQHIEGQKRTMADLFQDAFSASGDMWPALPATSRSGSNYHGRLLQVLQLEKERHAKFSRLFRALQSSSSKIDKSTPVTVQIISRSLEGHLTVCHCLFQPPLDDKKQSERFRDEEAKKGRMVIFNSKICENVDLVVGNLICIYPPWKEVLVKEENVILCSCYSNVA